MAVVTPPYVLQAGSHPASTFRQNLQLVFGSPYAAFAGGVQPTTGGGGHGVMAPTDLATAQNGTPNMSVNVSGGLCAIRGTESQHQGVYTAYNDGTANLAIAAADPTNPRRDLVAMRVRDAAYSGASNDVALVAVTGTPAAVPVDPAPPANSLVLARVAVAALASSITNANITRLAPTAYTLGAIAPVTSSLRPSSPADPTTIYERDTERGYTWDGSAWRPTLGSLPRCHVYNAGTQTINDNTDTAITFDTELYDTDDIHSTSVNTARFTVPADMGGLWHVGYKARFNSGVAGTVQAWIRIGGAGNIRYAHNAVTIPNTTDVAVLSGSAQILLAAGEYVELVVNQDNASNVTRTSGGVTLATVNEMWATYAHRT